MGNLSKLWLRLMGIGEEEEADLSRRGFLKMLGGAAVVAAAPTYVFAPSGGWETPTVVSFENITAITYEEFIIPMLADNFFKASPIFTKLRTYGQLDPEKRFNSKKYRGFVNV